MDLFGGELTENQYLWSKFLLTVLGLILKFCEWLIKCCRFSLTIYHIKNAYFNFPLHSVILSPVSCLLSEKLKKGLMVVVDTFYLLKRIQKLKLCSLLLPSVLSPFFYSKVDICLVLKFQVIGNIDKICKWEMIIITASKKW